ncbi:MAG: ATP-binding protein, partial [Telluria sp.]
EPMSLADVLLDCNVLIGPQAQNRGIGLVFPSFDEALYIHADLTRVKQVMINLLSNAIKYNRPGGVVTVRYERSGAHCVRILVADSGNGLTAAQIGQLFQPFNRLGQEDSTEEGTGIGLVVTKQLVELMNGTIGVTSEPGIGTEFWVEFPIASAPTLMEAEHSVIASAVLTPPVAQAGKLRTLLYVEDNPANMELVEMLIARRSDLKLLTAINGHLGVVMARSYKPDVILMDINLPGLSGIGALKILLNDPATAHIPVIALSANAVPRDIERGMEAGFFRYLTKPIKVVEFMDALDVALNFAEQNGLGPTAVAPRSVDTSK